MKQRNYYAPGRLEGKVILDPMMGGGTTLHEAIRLNLALLVSTSLEFNSMLCGYRGNTPLGQVVDMNGCTGPIQED